MMMRAADEAQLSDNAEAPSVVHTKITHGKLDLATRTTQNNTMEEQLDALAYVDIPPPTP